MQAAIQCDIREDAKLKKQPDMDLTRAYIKTFLSYDKDTGVFRYTKARGRNGTVKAGDIADSVDSKGYLRIGIDNKSYLLHRLAFLLVNGSFPKDFVDHINGIKTDNSWSNLRPATNSQNMMNSACVRGKHLRGTHKAPSGRFQSRIRINNKVIYLGTFDTEIEAHQAYVERSKELHGAFSSYTRRS